MLMFSSQSFNQLSLEDFSNDFCEQHGITISKQALQERFNMFSVSFMSELLKRQLSHHIANVEKITDYKHFSRVRVRDSTRYSLPKEYTDVYKGHGGIGSPSQISIQYEYDLLSGSAMSLELTSACRNDQQDSKETLHTIEKGDLLIRDLAYASKNYLQHITKMGAYYLNRCNVKWDVYDKDGVVINWNKILKRLKKYSLPAMEMEAFIPTKNQCLATRLVITRVDANTYEKRLKKAHIAAGSKHYQVSQKYKVYAALNVFITNIPKPWLSINQIRKTYSLRWQIELIFRVWKSQANINKVKAVKIERFQCQLIARLLWLLLHWKILAITQRWIIRRTKNKYFKCSVWKFYKVAFRLSNLLRQTLLNYQSDLLWLEKLLFNAEKKYFTEIKKGKPCYSRVLYNLLA